jgi:hypothetical protein
MTVLTNKLKFTVMKKLSIAFMVFVLAFAVSSFNADAIELQLKLNLASVMPKEIVARGKAFVV